VELWLLGAGAVVLIAVTVWLVWLAPPSDAADSPDQPEEEQPVPERSRPAVTAPVEGGMVQTRPPVPSAVASELWSSPTLARERATVDASEPGSARSARSLRLAAGLLLSLGSALAGAWLYARWRHKRETPVSRLRRHRG
jgi:hypothetical protein